MTHVLIAIIARAMRMARQGRARRGKNVSTGRYLRHVEDALPWVKGSEMQFAALADGARGLPLAHLHYQTNHRTAVQPPRTTRRPRRSSALTRSGLWQL